MPITFICPQCQCKMTVPDTLAGKRGKCSKCKGDVTVPAVPNGAAGNGDGVAKPAAPVGAKKQPAPPPTKTPAPPNDGKAPQPAPKPAGRTPPPTQPAASAPPSQEEPPAPVDVEAAALAALADEPAAVQAAKDANRIEFECPMCNEPLKMPLEMGGKKCPCPSCKRIIPVPLPRPDQRSSWRDTGPALPSAARRHVEAAPEDAWGTKNVTGVSQEALKETGVIEERAKPLTWRQRAVPYVVFGGPVLILLVGGVFLFNWMARNKEKQAVDFAVQFTADDKSRAAVGADGLAALHGNMAIYHLRTNRPGCAGLARDQLTRAVALAGASRNPECDGLMIDLAGVALNLGGNAEELEADTRLKWDLVHATLRNTLSAIVSPEARLEGLRRVAVGLAERGQTQRVLPLAAQLYASGGADRAEALAVAGLELLAQGNNEEAIKAAEQSEASYATKDRPALRSSVVALAIALNRKPPAPEKGVEEEEANLIGEAEGWARQGNPANAKKSAGKLVSSVARFRAQVGVAIAPPNGKPVDPEAVSSSLAQVPKAGAGPPWLVLRLIAAGLRANVPIDSLEPAASAAKPLAGWGRLLLLRARLAGSRGALPADVLEAFPANSLAGHVARLDLSRHNIRADSGWVNVVKTWDDGPRAFGSLGVALGLQSGK